MSKRLAEYVGSRDNNYNLIRFIAATLVLISHSYALATGESKLEPLREWLGITWGIIAVDIFFVTSGFLIAYSFFNRKSLSSFVWARFLRIYPGLLVAILFCVFIVGLFFTTDSAYLYLTNEQTVKYFFKNITLVFGIEHQLPSVFHETPHRYLVNASLWTLPYELTMYCALAIAGIAVIYVNSVLKVDIMTFAFITMPLLGALLTITNHFYNFAPENITRLFALFFMGAAFYLFRNKIFLSHKLTMLMMLAIAVSLLNADIFYITFFLSLPYLVFYLAYIPNGKIRAFNKMGDYSYGIYIYAFPIQQSIAMLIPNVSISTMIWASFSTTIIFAFLSWHLIEKKCLALKKAKIF